jgi:hypothetical protein
LQSGSAIQLRSCECKGNLASVAGGGLVVGRLSKASCYGLTSFESNHAKYGGSIAVISGYQLNIDDQAFININASSASRGSAIYYFGLNLTSTSPIRLRNIMFSNNIASDCLAGTVYCLLGQR